MDTNSFYLETYRPLAFADDQTETSNFNQVKVIALPPDVYKDTDEKKFDDEALDTDYIPLKIPDDEKEEKKENKLKTTSKPKITNPKRIKWTIIKNVLCISFAFTLLFTSFNSMSNLQSSLHRQMGTVSLGVIYVALVTSCFFVPTFVIKTLKPKWGVCLAMLLYSPYFAAMYYPRYYTFIPAGLLMGLAGAPLWASKCTYVSKIAEKYGEAVGESYDVVIVRFFGIFFFFLQVSQVLGNLISSSILSVGVSDFQRSDEFLDLCGANFCPDFKLDSEVVSLNSSSLTQDNLSVNSTEASHEMSDDKRSKIFIMTAIYLTLALSAVAFVAIFVDPLTKYGIEVTNSGKIQDLLFATFRHMKKPYQILITPLTIWSGIQQGFLSAEYTASFVTCSIGVHMVGYSYLCFGVSDAIFTLAFTPLIKYVKRIPIFTLGTIINLVMIIVMFTWRPNPDHYIVFFIIPTFWGMADAVWQTQINAFYGVIFPDEAEAAFSNYRLWESLGFIFAYLISGAFCMSTKMYILLLSLVTGMAGYYTIEFSEWRKCKKDSV